MRIRLTLATVTAMTMAGALTLNAQTPRPQNPTPQTQPQTDRQRTGTDTQSRADASQQSVTITGCLKEEKDVPGRTPNVAERAGVGEDYILTNVKMGKGSTTSAMGLASMYQVKGIDDSELKKHLNHQVEVTGRLEASGSTMGADRSAGAARTSANNNNNLHDIHATSIRMLAQTCPANQ